MSRATRSGSVRDHASSACRYARCAACHSGRRRRARSAAASGVEVARAQRSLDAPRVAHRRRSSPQGRGAAEGGDAGMRTGGRAVLRAHQRRQASSNAAPRARARTPARRKARSRASRAGSSRRSVRQCITIGECARDDGDVIVAVARDPAVEPQRRTGGSRSSATATLRPASVTTGTPCHSISSVVVAPENGRGSSAMSTRGGLAAKRIAARPRGRRARAPPRRRTRRARAPARCRRRTPTTTSRAVGIAASRRAQSASVSSVSFEPLLNEPSVGWPAASIGSGPAAMARRRRIPAPLRRARGGASVSLCSASLPGGSLDGIRQPIVDGVEPGRVEVIEPRDLHRRGLAPEHAQAVVARMAGDVDQDVDADRRGSTARPQRRRAPRITRAVTPPRRSSVAVRLWIVEVREHVEARRSCARSTGSTNAGSAVWQSGET